MIDIDPLDEVNRGFWRRWFANADFDPVTLTAGIAAGASALLPSAGTLAAGSAAATAVGGGISALGALAQGNYARQAAGLQATQLRTNAAQAIGASQRTMLDTQEKARLAGSAIAARAAASGVNAGVGSPLTDTGEVAQRGEYHALLDLFNGQSAATGMENEAKAAEWTGKMQQDSSYLAAGGDIASSIGQGLGTYGSYLRSQAPVMWPEYRWGN